MFFECFLHKSFFVFYLESILGLVEMKAKTFSAGLKHSLFLTEDYRVLVCGTELGTTVDGNSGRCTEIPQEVDLPDISSVAAGNEFSLYLDSIGNVWGSGSSSYGEFGIMGKYKEPIKLENLPPIQSIQPSHNYYSVFLDVDGYVWSCGYNGYGQLGLGHLTTQFVPTKIENIPKITSLSTGFYHTLMIDERGGVWGCGYNVYGQVGVKGLENKLLPTQLHFPTPITTISAGDFHTFFIDESESVWACGHNLSGQLGFGTNTDVLAPQKIESLQRIVNVSAGRSNGVFLDADWNVWACGTAEYLRTSSSKPVRCNQLENIRALSCTSHFLFLDGTSTIWVAGENSDGQLGMGNREKVPLPERNANLPPIAGTLRYSTTKSA